MKRVVTPNGVRYQVLGKTTGADASAAMRNAWEIGTQIIAERPRLTQLVHDRHSAGDFVETEYLDELIRYTQFTPLFPPGATLVKFYDTLNKSTRVGFRLAESDTQFDFTDLLSPKAPVAPPSGNRRPAGILSTSFAMNGLDSSPAAFRTEVIEKSQIASGTLEANLSDTSIRGTVDELDYQLYRCLRAINDDSISASNEKPRVYLFVDQVYADLEGWGGMFQSGYLDGKGGTGKYRRENLMGISPEDHFLPKQPPLEFNPDFSSRLKQDSHGAAVWLSLAADAINFYSRLKARTRDRREQDELDEKISKTKLDLELCRKLVTLENQLSDSIRSKLTPSHVFVVDGSERAKSTFVNYFTKANATNAKSLNGPSRSIPWSKVIGSEMMNATHVLFATIRRPSNPESGQYELSMRVVRLSDLAIRCEVQGDRLGPSLIAAEIQAAKIFPKLNGLYETDVPGERVRVTEDTAGKVVVILAGSSAEANRPAYFQLEGKRNGNEITVTSCSVSVHYEIAHRQLIKVGQSVRAEMSIADANNLVISHQPILGWNKKLKSAIVGSEMRRASFHLVK